MTPHPKQGFDRQRGTVRQTRGERLPRGRAFGGRPWWLLVAALLVAALVGAGTLAAHAVGDRLAAQAAAGRPDALAEAHLTGPRSPNPVSVVLLLDVSGSFADYAELRRQALDQVIRWAPRNLREDDTLTIVSFAKSAELTLPATSMAELADGAPAVNPRAADGRDTLIVPALDKAAAALPDAAGASVIVLTDTQVTDASTAGVDPLLSAMNATTMSVITPTGVGIIPPWREAFAWEAEFHAAPGDAGQTALAVGEALAHATGQRLQR